MVSPVRRRLGLADVGLVILMAVVSSAVLGTVLGLAPRDAPLRVMGAIAALILLLGCWATNTSVSVGVTVPDRFIRQGRTHLNALVFGAALGVGVVRQRTGVWAACIVTMLTVVPPNEVWVPAVTLGLIRTATVVVPAACTDSDCVRRRLQSLNRFRSDSWSMGLQGFAAAALVLVVIA